MGGVDSFLLVLFFGRCVLYLGVICEKVAIFFVLYSFFHIFVAIGKIMNLKCRSCMTAVAHRVNPLG